MKRSLTLRYALHQMAYWSISAGVVSFASAFLIGKGFAAGTVGTLLALGNLLSCAAQPLLAGYADRSGSAVLKRMMLTMTALSFACFALLLLLPANALFGVSYLLGVFFLDAMNPLLNATNVACSAEGYTINYGLGRGMGSLAYSFVALAIGKAMAAWGNVWMLYISLLLLVLNGAIVAGYPSLRSKKTRVDGRQTCCTLGQFVLRYRWYCFSLLGVVLLAMFHAMTENYLIRIVEPLGGDSSHVGTALFVATTTAFPMLACFDRVRKKLSDGWILRLSGVFFLLKGILLYNARSVGMVYGIQMLQMVTYGFLSPAQMYYAERRVRADDMVKGQAFITAAYTLGCAAGNFVGGQILQYRDVRALLGAGVLVAACGTAVFFLTIPHEDGE